MIACGHMTDEQHCAHERLTALLTSRILSSDPEKWPESGRDLSPEELEYLSA